MPDLPETEVVKNLDVILETARQEYKVFIQDRWATQNAKLYTYLWLSVTILTAVISLFNLMWPRVHNIPGLFLLALAGVCSFSSFILAIDAMRGRAMTGRMLPSDYDKIFDLAYTDSALLRKEIISVLVGSVLAAIPERNSIGLRMRVLSRLNTAGAGATCAACILFFSVTSF